MHLPPCMVHGAPHRWCWVKPPSTASVCVCRFGGLFLEHIAVLLHDAMLLSCNRKTACQQSCIMLYLQSMYNEVCDWIYQTPYWQMPEIGSCYATLRICQVCADNRLRHSAPAMHFNSLQYCGAANAAKNLLLCTRSETPSSSKNAVTQATAVCMLCVLA